MDTRALNVEVKLRDKWRWDVEERDEDINLSKDERERDEMVEKTTKD